jgi:hypothetical protein
VQDPVTDLPLVNGSNDSASTGRSALGREWHWDPFICNIPIKHIEDMLWPLTLIIAGLGRVYLSDIYLGASEERYRWFAHMQYLDNNIRRA